MSNANIFQTFAKYSTGISRSQFPDILSKSSISEIFVSSHMCIFHVFSIKSSAAGRLFDQKSVEITLKAHVKGLLRIWSEYFSKHYCVWTMGSS